MKNPLKYDPSRTGTIRKKFIRAISRKLREVRGDINRLIIEEDSFGLKKRNNGLSIFNEAWADKELDKQLELFQQYIKSRLFRAFGIDVSPEEAEAEGLGSEKMYWRAFINQGYRKGAGRAFQDFKAYLEKSGKPIEQNQLDFLDVAFNRPISEEKLNSLIRRTSIALRGVAEDTSAKLTFLLAEGLTRGDSPYVIARDINQKIDSIGRKRAERIARTEIIRAHAEGQLDQMENMGAEKVSVMVEWSTTGDEKVCPLCRPMNGVVLKIKEARGMIPRHPNCRCAFVPANVGESQDKQKRKKAAIDEAIKKSLRAELPKKDKKKKLTLDELKERSSWAGGKNRIAKERLKPKLKPESVLKKAGFTSKPSKPKSGTKKKQKPKSGSVNPNAEYSIDRVPKEVRLSKEYHTSKVSYGTRQVTIGKLGYQNLLEDKEAPIGYIPDIYDLRDKKLDELNRKIDSEFKRLGIKEAYSKDILKSGLKRTLVLASHGELNSEEGLKTYIKEKSKSYTEEVNKSLKKLLTDPKSLKTFGNEIDNWVKTTQSELNSFDKKLKKLGYVNQSGKVKSLPVAKAIVFNRVADKLTEKLGKPEVPSFGDVKIWYTKNGRSIRLSKSKLYEYFDDSGVEFVPFDLSSDIEMTLAQERAYFHPERLAEAIIKVNEHLPKVDKKKATERLKKISRLRIPEFSRKIKEALEVEEQLLLKIDSETNATYPQKRYAIRSSKFYHNSEEIEELVSHLTGKEKALLSEYTYKLDRVVNGYLREGDRFFDYDWSYQVLLEAYDNYGTSGKSSQEVGLDELLEWAEKKTEKLKKLTQSKSIPLPKLMEKLVNKDDLESPPGSHFRHLGALYRGLSWDRYPEKQQDFIDELLYAKDNGEPYKVSSFSSASFNTGPALGFASGRQDRTLMLEIIPKDGIPLGNELTQFSGEYELLLSPDKSYLVDSIKDVFYSQENRYKKTVRLIELE